MTPLAHLRLRCQLTLAAFLFSALAAALQAAELRRPNVLIFLADDAGWGDYGFSGNTMVATPNIDRIARGGASLERFFVQPVCAPTNRTRGCENHCVTARRESATGSTVKAGDEASGSSRAVPM